MSGDTKFEGSGAPAIRVVAVLFPGFELLDFFGPLEFLGLLGDRVRVECVAMRAGVVESSCGVKGVAEFRLADVGTADLVLIPGGIGTRKLVLDVGFLSVLEQRCRSAVQVATVCTGSALLARTGLLDGHRATSNKKVFDWVTEQGTGVNWVRHARWVQSGKFLTSSGISAGMDMTLFWIEEQFGAGVACDVADRAEYLRNRDPNVDPFSGFGPSGL